MCLFSCKCLMQRLKQQIVQYCRRIWNGDGFYPALALSNDITFRSDADGMRLMQVEDIIDKFRVAWGVPKIRTCDGEYSPFSGY